MTNLKEDVIEIDVFRIMRALWHRAWVIVLAGILGAVAAFFLTVYLIVPQYSSSVMLYVNNSSFSLGNTSFSISSSEITAAQSLVKTYSELLKNRTTLERVIEKTGVPYTYEELFDMIEAGPSNNTEIMKVTVTGTDPYEASEIANCIAEVLPIRVAEIVDGASMEVVDSAIPMLKKVSPSVTKNTAIGLMLGVMIAVIVLMILAIMDDTIRDEDYVLKTYNYPILARIPDLLGSGSSSYGGYYSRAYGYAAAGKKGGV